MEVRNDVEVLDATLRDGGLRSDFMFTDVFLSELYKVNIKCGVDYMKFGYRASKSMLAKSDFKKWELCDEEDIRTIDGESPSPMKLSVVAAVGR